MRKKKQTQARVVEVDGCVIIPPGYDRPVFQGDMMLVRVDELPSGVEHANDNVVAHSETGHDHVAERAMVFTTKDAMTLYFKALDKEPVRLEHRRSFDAHKTIVFPPGEVWRVRRQREHTPEGWRRVED